MVKVFESAPTNFSGDQINGGTIKNFASTGISDNASSTTLVVTDGKITVPTISVNTVDGNVTVRGDVKIYGVLDAGFIRTTEIIANQRYEKQYLEFAPPEGNAVGCGLVWVSGTSKQFILRNNPERFFSTENIDIPATKTYCIETVPVLSQDSLGRNIVNSNLKTVGVLRNLATSGNLTVDNYIHYSGTSNRLGLGIENPNALLSVFDFVHGVEVIVDSNASNGYGKLGTFNTKGLELVTDDTARISITENGNITLGQEQKDSTLIRAYGKLSVGVKNPTEQFEVAGNVKFGNRLFTNGNSSPESGVYQIGDIVWNTNPTPGTFVGWVCIISGSPGVWNGFGLIAN